MVAPCQQIKSVTSTAARQRSQGQTELSWLFEAHSVLDCKYDRPAQLSKEHSGLFKRNKGSADVSSRAETGGPSVALVKV